MKCSNTLEVLVRAAHKPLFAGLLGIRGGFDWIDLKTVSELNCCASA